MWLCNPNGFQPDESQENWFSVEAGLRPEWDETLQEVLTSTESNSAQPI